MSGGKSSNQPLSGFAAKPNLFADEVFGSETRVVRLNGGTASGNGVVSVPSLNAYSVCCCGGVGVVKSESSSNLPVPTKTQRSTPLSGSILISGGVVTGWGCPSPSTIRPITPTFACQVLGSGSDTSKRQRLPQRSPT